jgi:sugar phosphate isomerase/epimerase
MENLDLDDIKRKVIKRFFDEGQPIYLTLDTAKMYSRNNELNKQDFDFFLEHKDRIREMHIHDLNKEYGGHQIVGNGFIDFSIFKQFVKNDVYINFEVRPIEAAMKSKNAIDMMWNF